MATNPHLLSSFLSIYSVVKWIWQFMVCFSLLSKKGRAIFFSVMTDLKKKNKVEERRTLVGFSPRPAEGHKVPADEGERGLQKGVFSTSADQLLSQKPAVERRQNTLLITKYHISMKTQTFDYLKYDKKKSYNHTSYCDFSKKKSIFPVNQVRSGSRGLTQLNPVNHSLGVSPYRMTPTHMRRGSINHCVNK